MAAVTAVRKPCEPQPSSQREEYEHRQQGKRPIQAFWRKPQPPPRKAVRGGHPPFPIPCRGCGEALNGDDLEPHLQQVLYIPKLDPFVIQQQLHRLI